METHFDVIILGSNRNSSTLASNLVKKGKKVALIVLPDRPESSLEIQTAALYEQTLSPSQPQIECRLIEGDFQFTSRNHVKINEEILSAEKFIINCGARPNIPNLEGFDFSSYFIPQEILLQKAMPKSVLVVGGGPAGVVTAQKLAKLGSQISLLTRSKQILPDEDHTISDLVTNLLKTAQVEVTTGQNLRSFQNEDLKFEAIVLATGLNPNTIGKQFNAAGVYVNAEGYIVTNEEMQTSTPHIWAMGACTEFSPSVSFEKYQAQLIEANLNAPFFSKSRLDSDPYPSSIPCFPPVARLGLTEREATAKYKDIKTITSTSRTNNGFIKLVGRKKRNQLLGVHILGPEAESIILYFDLVMRAQIPLEDLGDSHHYIGYSAGELIDYAIQEWRNS